MAANFWLSEWADDPPGINGTVDTAQRDLRLGVYGALGILQGNGQQAPVEMYEDFMLPEQNTVLFLVTFKLTSESLGILKRRIPFLQRFLLIKPFHPPW